MPTNTPMFSAGAPRTEVKYPFTRISWPSRVRVTAAGSFKSALLTPKRAPVITLMRIKAMTAAKAPPARSFAQEPPMATANRMCRLLITAQPMVSMVLPIVRTAPISPPAICMSFPTLIISPAAGMTAMTVIRTLPSFWRKSKLTRDFFWLSGFPVRSVCGGKTYLQLGQCPDYGGRLHQLHQLLRLRPAGNGLKPLSRYLLLPLQDL